MIDFDDLIRDWGLALKRSLEILDYYPIEVEAIGTEHRFASWQEDVDAGFRVEVPFSEILEDDLVVDESGNKFDPWEGRRLRTSGEKGSMPVNLVIWFATPNGDHIAIEQKGVLEFKILDSAAFSEHSKNVSVLEYFIREVLIRELWPFFRQSVFHQFDSWRLPRPDLPWSHPNISKLWQNNKVN